MIDGIPDSILILCILGLGIFVIAELEGRKRNRFRPWWRIRWRSRNW